MGRPLASIDQDNGRSHCAKVRHDVSDGMARKKWFKEISTQYISSDRDGTTQPRFPRKAIFSGWHHFEETADEVWICKEQIDTAKLPKLILHANTKTYGTEEEQREGIAT